jgi:hypothetical protein
VVNLLNKGLRDAISLVLYCVDGEFRKKHPNFLANIKDERVWMNALRVADANGLLFYFCKRVVEEGSTFRRPFNAEMIVRREEEKFSQLRRTLAFLSSLFADNGMDFRFIKLYRGLPYVPRDVDVLITSEEVFDVVSLLRRRGFAVDSFDDVEIRCQRAGLLKVDLYCGFCYLSLPFIDEGFLWRDSRIVDVQGVDCPIPGFEADFLSLVIHSLLGHRRLSLLDFLYAKSLLNSERLRFDKMLKEAEKFGWAHAFTKVFHALEDLYESLYSIVDFPRGISFPFVYSTKFVFEAFEGFAGLPVDVRTKFLFGLSAFLDAIYHKYLNLWQVIPIEIPKQLKNIVAKSLYKVRQQRGDRKTSAFSN